MMDRILALALFLPVVASCGGNRGGADEPAPPPPADEVDLAAIAQDVTSYIESQNATIPQGDIPAFAGYLAEDVFWFGSSAAEALIGRDAVVEDLAQVFGPAAEAGGTFAIDAGPLEVGVAPDGTAAWTAQTLDVIVTVGDQEDVIPYRVTSLLAEDGGSWTIVAQAWSIGLANEQAFEMAATGQFQAPAPITEDVGEGADALIARMEESGGDAKVWVDSYSDRPDALSVGSAPTEFLVGGDAVKGEFGQMAEMFQMKVAPSGGMHARLTPSGTAGFIACNLDTTFVIEGAPVTMTYRTLMVYVNEDGSWNLVQTHFSNGL